MIRFVADAKWANYIYIIEAILLICLYIPIAILIYMHSGDKIADDIIYADTMHVRK